MQQVLEQIKEDEIVKLCRDLVDIPSLTGHERQVGEFVVEWLRENGIKAIGQGLGEDRMNAIGILEGTGGGLSLQFNGHLDTNYSGDQDDLTYMNRELFNRPEHTKKSFVRDGRIYGVGVGNMKAGLAAMLSAIKAIKQSGISLKGDVVVSGVAGENGGAPVAQYQGVRYEGTGFGTAQLLNRGIHTDYAICADNSNLKLTWVTPGVVLLRITTYSLPGGAWATAASGRENSQNAIIKMLPVIEACEKWSAEFSANNKYVCEGGELTPTAHICHIESGRPYNMAVRPGVCVISAVAYIPPGLKPIDVANQVRAAIRAADVEAEVEIYRATRGYEAQGVSGLVEILREKHQKLFDAKLEICDPPYCGPWTDTALYNERGIPCVKLGVGLSAAERLEVGIEAYDEHPIEDIVKATKLFALTAVEVCSREKL